jgi:gentisate 1,2-dioxygenase
MTVQELAAGTQYSERARYNTSENPFTFRWPAVPVHKFMAERDRAFDPTTPTGAIALDISAELGIAYPATTPTLLARYLRIRAGEELHTAFVAAGEACYVMKGQGESRNGSDLIAWGAGDVFCFPGGSETRHLSLGADCLLFVATNEPLLAFEGLRSPAPGRAVVQATHWPAEEIERRFEAVWKRPITDNTTGHSVNFTTASMLPNYVTMPSINVAINTLAPGCDQRPHRHNGVAITLALQGEGIHSVIEGQRVDWVDGAAQITPATLLHSHHNRGTKRMRSLVIQDEGLHMYTRTPGFSFD